MKRLTAQQYAHVLSRAYTAANSAERAGVIERFVALLSARRAWKLVPRILQHIEAIEDAQAGLTKVAVWQAKDAPTAELAEALTQVLGPVRLETRTDPKLIGGLKFRIHDQLIDGTLAHQLQRLHTQLINA